MSTNLSISADQFEAEVLKADGPVLVDFWAPWCGPCLQLGPRIDALADELGDKLRVVKVDVDEAGEVAARYNVFSIPALKLFKDGEVVAEMVGSQSDEMLRSLVEPHID